MLIKHKFRSMTTRTEKIAITNELEVVGLSARFSNQERIQIPQQQSLEGSYRKLVSIQRTSLDILLSFAESSKETLSLPQIFLESEVPAAATVKLSVESASRLPNAVWQ